MRTIKIGLLFLALSIAVTHAQKSNPVISDPSGILPTLESSFKTLRNITAHFAQRNPEGSQVAGMMILAQGVGFRMDYDRYPLRIIANTTMLQYHDLELGEVSHYNLADTPVSFLMFPERSFKDLVSHVETRQTALGWDLILTPKSRDYVDSVSLHFSKNFSLIGWDLVDANGGWTSVSLTAIKGLPSITKEQFSMHSQLHHKKHR